MLKSRFLIGVKSGFLVGFYPCRFAILPPDSSVFILFCLHGGSLWFSLFLLGVLFFESPDLCSVIPQKMRSKVLSSAFLLLASISHSTTLVFTFIFLLVSFKGDFVDSLLLLYRFRLKASSFVPTKALDLVLLFVQILIFLALSSLSYFYTRISHYSDFSSFDGSYIQALLSVVLSVFTAFCIVYFSRGFNLGPLAKAYALLPMILIPIAVVMPASAYRLSTQYYFLGFICLSFVLIDSVNRSFSCRNNGLPESSVRGYFFFYHLNALNAIVLYVSPRG